ncbi:MAG: hypothetical protein RIC19_25320 [Phaeodactylibacter sp.]|uniref:hypothetical protein n=1 Tax=Phaeodactylibacter sp. TaxID=1940289 RepID=UPI0032ECF749
MRNNKTFFAFGLLFLLTGIAAVFFSQMIIEDVLQVEREFGQEPLSLSFVRAGLAGAILGAGLLVFGAWRNRRQKK